MLSAVTVIKTSLNFVKTCYCEIAIFRTLQGKKLGKPENWLEIGSLEKSGTKFSVRSRGTNRILPRSYQEAWKFEARENSIVL